MIRPGAQELCDGIDNNCNGVVDESKQINITNGIGQCQQGKVSVLSCKKGYADCDGKIENGCEIDIMNDQENCGACGNICTLENCAAGSC